MYLERVLIDTKEIATKAGTFILQRMNHIKSLDYKQGDFSNIVTDVDKASEKMIIEFFNLKYPEFSILSEEGMNKSTENSEFKLIIDPIDGTTNFVHGFPFFCVSIGLEYKGKIVLGVIYDPSTKEMFHAIENRGSFLNDKNIEVSKNPNLKLALIATGFSNNLAEEHEILDVLLKITKETSSIRRTGSSALNLCYIACGRLDGYWERGLSPWDSAAGLLILKEAGGKITDYKSYGYSHYQSEIIATNGLIHEEIQSIIKRGIYE